MLRIYKGTVNYKVSFASSLVIHNIEGKGIDYNRSYTHICKTYPDAVKKNSAIVSNRTHALCIALLLSYGASCQERVRAKG